MTSVPSDAELRADYEARRNWGRWGEDDQIGALNLVTPERRLAALALARTGRTVSLSRPYPKTPGPRNPTPAQHFMNLYIGPRAGAVTDYYGFVYHGFTMTHIDALCHVWDGPRMWNDRDPRRELRAEGARFGNVTAWAGGIITRGVLLDVPRFRGERYVRPGEPVHGSELEAIAASEGVTLEPGDALVVYSGREAYVRDFPAPDGDTPGLHGSCAPVIRDHDVAMLVWDMMDASPNVEGLRWPVHGVLSNYGVALLDNALLEPLADLCAEEQRYEFALIVLPLVVEGGTGSPVNPIALF